MLQVAQWSIGFFPKNCNIFVCVVAQNAFIAACVQSEWSVLELRNRVLGLAACFIYTVTLVMSYLFCMRDVLKGCCKPYDNAFYVMFSVNYN
jgi:hypothetical protein